MALEKVRIMLMDESDMVEGISLRLKSYLKDIDAANEVCAM